MHYSVLYLCFHKTFWIKKKKIEIEKIAYITKALDLSSEEAQVFWPLYNKYSDKKNEINIKRMKEFAKVKDNRSSLTEKEIGSIINKQLKMEQEILDLKVNYNKEFQKVISNTQISKLYHAELEFRKKLLRRMSKGIGHNNLLNKEYSPHISRVRESLVVYQIQVDIFILI